MRLVCAGIRQIGKRGAVRILAYFFENSQFCKRSFHNVCQSYNHNHSCVMILLDLCWKLPEVFLTVALIIHSAGEFEFPPNHHLIEGSSNRFG
jgi:hypothetical protein